MSQICIHEQLRGLVQENGWTIKQFATETGLPYRTAQDYLNGKRMPGCESLAQIATSLRVNLDWLVFGEGPRERGGELSAQGHEQGSETSLPIGLEAVQLEEGQRARDELGLEAVATLARLGTAGESWSILEQLLSVFPEGLTLEELGRVLGEEPRQIAAHLTKLRGQGSVEEAAPGYYRLGKLSENRILRSESLGDRHQVILRAAGALANQILPGVLAGNGKLVLLEGRVGDGEALLKAWRQAVADFAAKAEDSEGESDSFTLVAALATDRDSQ